MPLEGFCTRQLGAAIMDKGPTFSFLNYRKIETPLSLFLVSVSLNTSTKDKRLPWRGLSALSFYREGRALHTQHSKHTAGNTHRHRRLEPMPASQPQTPKTPELGGVSVVVGMVNSGVYCL